MTCSVGKPTCSRSRSPLPGVSPPFIASKMKKGPDHPMVGAFFFVMEARGVEPLSENNGTQASTGVVAVLMSPGRRPETGFAPDQPDCLLPTDPRRRPIGVSH
jgi:hypothetical protein